MKQFTTEAYIASLNIDRFTATKMGTITILEELDGNKYKVRVESTGEICTAIYNPFREAYYADDVHGLIEE